jgi:hypothetical protein
VTLLVNWPLAALALLYKTPVAPLNFPDPLTISCSDTRTSFDGGADNFETPVSGTVSVPPGTV